MDPFASLTVGLAVLSLVTSGSALLLALRSAPRALQRAQDDLLADVKRLVALHGDVSTKQEALEVRMATFLEEAGETLGRVETKRRRAERAAQHADQREAAEKLDPTQEAILRARQAGFMV